MGPAGKTGGRRVVGWRAVVAAGRGNTEEEGKVAKVAKVGAIVIHQHRQEGQSVTVQP
jgi:hypothetical protein